MAERRVYDDVESPSVAGVATITCPPVDFEKQWIITRLSIEGSSLTIPYCEVLRSIGGTLYRVDYTDSGNNDTAEYPDGLAVQQAEKLVIRWTGCTSAALLKASVQYLIEDLREDRGGF